jgi:hypothetical protein
VGRIIIKWILEKKINSLIGEYNERKKFGIHNGISLNVQ